MKGAVVAIAFLILGLVTGTLSRAAFGGGRPRPPGSPDEVWRRTTAEVVPSGLRTRDRRFLRVRYTVGTSLIENDVLYALGGAVPPAGELVFVRYDVMAPARVILDAGRPRSPGAGVSPSERADPNG